MSTTCSWPSTCASRDSREGTTKVSTKNVQRKISAEDVQFPGYLRAPIAAKPTALGLWLHTDGLGRREVVPELIAAAIYPGEAATELVIEHLRELQGRQPVPGMRSGRRP